MANIRYSIEVDDVEFATVIAALRMWQWILESGTQMPKINPKRIREIIEIANSGFNSKPLEASQVAALADRLIPPIR